MAAKTETFGKTIDKLAVYEGFKLTRYDEIKGNSLYKMYQVLLINKHKQKLTRVRTHYNSLLFLIVESIDKEKKEEIKKAIIKEDPELNDSNKTSPREANLIAQREFIIMLRELLLLTTNIIQMTGFWSEYLDEYPPEEGQIITRKTSNDFLYDLIKKIGKELPDDFVVIEKKYKSVSAIITLFSKKYLLVEAFNTYRLYLNNDTNGSLIWNKIKNPIKAIVKFIFSMPICAGIIVGWLAVLSTEEFIRYLLKYILVPSDNFWLLIKTISIVSVILFVNFGFIFFAGPKDGDPHFEKRSAFILLISTLFSCSIGCALLLPAYGQQWLSDAVSNKAEIEICAYQRISFILIWSSMAVFIGIFAQIIWSGRGPTEISD